MKNFLLKLIAQTAAVLAVAYLVPGIVVKDFPTAIAAACILSIINALIRPFLLLLTLPITVVSLGIFVFFINGFCFWLASTLVPGFSVVGVLPAVLGAIVFGIASWFLNWVLQPNNDDDFPEQPRQGSRPIKIVPSESRDV